MEHSTGIRGCCGKTKRRGRERYCAQMPICYIDGKGYCYYHNPRNPKKFGEGYRGFNRVEAATISSSEL